MKRLEDKVALVTGGAMGIGRETCLALAREGAEVVVTDVDLDALRDTLQALEGARGQAQGLALDVSDREQVREVCAEVEQAHGRLDILVNNAGIAGPDEPTHEIDADAWQQLMDVNVLGVFLCTKAAIPLLRRAGGGSIVNLSSIYGIVGAGDLPAYHASKGAVRLMTKNDAVTYAREGIRVNSVHPGFIWTPLVEKLAGSHPDGADAFRAELDARHPVGHVGEPADIAAGIVYLVSDEAKFVVGSELVIDGGYTAR